MKKSHALLAPLMAVLLAFPPTTRAQMKQTNASWTKAQEKLTEPAAQLENNGFRFLDSTLSVTSIASLLKSQDPDLRVQIPASAGTKGYGLRITPEAMKNQPGRIKLVITAYDQSFSKRILSTVIKNLDLTASKKDFESNEKPKIDRAARFLENGLRPYVMIKNERSTRMAQKALDLFLPSANAQISIIGIIFFSFYVTILLGFGMSCVKRFVKTGNPIWLVGIILAGAELNDVVSKFFVTTVKE